MNQQPIILALETGSTTCQVGLVVGGRFVIKQKSIRSHSQVVLSLIDELLEEAGVSLQDIAAIAVNQGPGSFTGLRVGLSVAQGLAYAVECPVIPIISLDAMAAAVAARTDFPVANYCMVAIDARMDQIYTAWFAIDSSGPIPELKRLTELAVVNPTALCMPPVIEQQLGAQQVIAASGTGMQYLDQFPDVLKERLSLINRQDGAEHSDVDMETLLTLGLRRFERGELVAAGELDAVYVRNRVAHGSAQ